MERSIAIIGFMGSGKSTLGFQLAKELGLQFQDLDRYIEASTGRSIPDIFQLKGEKEFRKIESSCLREILESQQMVVALGGGTPCFNDNIKLIKDLSRSIYLRISPEALKERLLRSHTPRPLIQGMSGDELLDYIREELKRREGFYMQADHIIESDRIMANDLLGLFLA